LANSIISGVSQILKEHDKVIVLEDDLITSPNFLDFMNQALNFYQGNKQIHSISGYTLDLPSLKNYTKDYYLGYRASSWGWGTWKEKWESVDWNVSKYREFKRNPLQQIKFMKGGSDLPHMLSNQIRGKLILGLFGGVLINL
jgi:GR25 family glycosyltransferase involved in LPS biosynthesis